MSASTCPPNAPAADRLHAAFLALLPRIELHADIYFRHLRCPDRKEEALAEVIALAWTWFVRLAERGKDPAAFAGALATYAARAVKCGRRACGHERVNEVLSPVARRRHGFRVESLPTATQAGHDRLYATPLGQETQDAFEERLRDNTLTPVPDQAAFRIDFPAWLRSLTGRERRVIRAMVRNERTKDLSLQFDVSPARISQMRRAFHDDWLRYHGEEISARDPAGSR